jgi:hypothetical protein
MKQGLQQSLLLTLLLLLGMPAWASQDGNIVLQEQWGRQVITVASDQEITFYDWKGTGSIASSSSNNSRSLTVFKPAEAGKSIQITFETCDVTNDGAQWFGQVLIYNGDPDPTGSFSYNTSLNSSSTMPEGDVVEKLDGTYSNKTYVSASADGSLSVGMLWRYAAACDGWVAKVKCVTLESMTVTGAGVNYDGVVASPATKQNVALANAYVTADGVMNPDHVTGIYFTLPTNDGVVNPTALKLFKGNDPVTATVQTDGAGYKFVLDDVLSDGTNTYTIKGDILGTAAVGAKVQAAVTKITTTAKPDGVTPFATATAVEVENPALVLMSATPQTITVGETALQFYDEGGKDGSIQAKTNGQVTFLSGATGKKVMVDFTKNAIWHGSYYNQELRIYSGQEVKAENLLRTLQQGETGIVRSTAADGSLTVVLFSDASSTTAADGFEALVSLFTPQPMDFGGIEVTPFTEGTVCAGDADQHILDINVKAVETEPAMQVTKMSFTTNGTQDLVTKATLFFNNNKVGETNVQADDFEITLTEPQVLAEGDNVFTLAYTVSDEALNEQTISAKAVSVTALVNAAVKTETVSDASPVGTRTVENIVLSHADQGTVTKTVNGTMAFNTKTTSSYSTYCEAGTDTRTNVFLPKHEGHIMQIDFSEFNVQYASSSYGTKSVFKIYAGQGTSGEVLWELNSNSQESTGPGQLIRSTAADGALTIVFCPNTSYSYYYNGFKATVSEYLPKPMVIAAIDATHPTTADVPVGGKQQQLLDIDVKTEGNLEPIVINGMTFNFKNTQQTIERVALYKGQTLLNALDVDGTLELSLDFSSDVKLAEGSNIFTLLADVKEDAEDGQTIDARVESVNIDEDMVKAVGENDPEGVRTVKSIVLMTAGDHGQMTLALGKQIMIYDDGGAEGDGADGVEATVTLAPTGEADCIKLTDMGIAFAYTAHLYIYKGSEVNADNLIVDLSGSSAKFQPIISDADVDGGKLTLRYVGKGSYTRPNFAVKAEGYKKTDVAIVGVTTEDISVGEVLKGQTDVKMLKIAVEAKGELAPATITNFVVDGFPVGNEQAAVEAYHIYQTGTTASFSANNEFTGEYAITNSGTYYFWLTYDVKTDAEVGQQATASVTAIVVDGSPIDTEAPATATISVASGKSGTYTVGQGGDYATIQQAIDDMGMLGMDGPVVLKVKAGEYNERVRIPYIKGMGAVNSLTIESESGQRDVKVYHDQYTASGYSDDQYSKVYGVVTLYEASYVTLRHLEITTTDHGYDAVIMVKNESRHVTIDDCYIHTATTTNNQQDINLISHYVADKDANGNYRENTNNDYLTISNSLLEGGYIAINMGGTGIVNPNLPKEVGGIIEGNTIKNPGSKAIYVMDELGAKIRNNTIIIDADAETKISVGILDLQLRDAHNESLEITGNIFNVAPKTYCPVMNFRQLEGQADAPVVIANNVINIASLNASYAGFKFNGAKIKNVNVAHNTIRMTGTKGGAAFWAASKLDDGYGNINVVNNIIQNETDGFAVNLYNDVNLGTGKINFQNNVMFTAGTTFFRASSSTTGDFATFVEKTSATNCLNKQVAFVSNDILLPDNTLDGDLLTALPLDYVATDITGRERPAEGRTIGAYEFDDSPRVAPTMAEGYPKVLNIGENTATVVVKSDMVGTAYVLVQKKGEEAPTADAMKQSSLKTLVAANAEATIHLTALEAETDYVAYAVAANSFGMLSEVATAEFATQEAHVDPATMDIWLNNDNAHLTTIDETESATIFVMGIEGGKAPFTLTVATAYGDVVETETIEADDVDSYMGMFEVEPTQPTDYILTLVDAQQNVTCDTVRIVVTGAAQMSTFDDLWYDSDEDGEYDYMFGPFWMNTVTESWGQLNYSGTFLSGSYSFSNNNMPAYGSFDGFAYSRSTSTTFSMNTYASDQFNAVTGGGYKGSESFAIGYVGFGSYPTVTVLNSEEGDRIKGFYVTNSAYTADAIVNGDGQQNVTDANGQACAPNEGFHQGDYVLLTATGYDVQGTQTGTVNFYLADYRSDDPSKHYYLQHWEWFDLTSLGVVKTIEFSMSATRQNQWGTTTPLYFCMDNFNDVNGMATGISTAAATTAKDALRYNAAGQKIGERQRGLNIVRQADGTVRKVMVK